MNWTADAKKAKEPKIFQWTVPMRLEFRVNATVEAATSEEATAKAWSLEVVDDGMGGAETVNWGVTGPVRKEIGGSR